MWMNRNSSLGEAEGRMRFLHEGKKNYRNAMSSFALLHNNTPLVAELEEYKLD